MQAADIYSLLVPIHYKLKTEQVKYLVESPSLDEFEVQIQKTYYGKRYQFSGELYDRADLYTECLHFYVLDKRRNPYSIAAINTYLFLKEEELRKLTTVIECIRYNLTPGETLLTWRESYMIVK